MSAAAEWACLRCGGCCAQPLMPGEKAAILRLHPLVQFVSTPVGKMHGQRASYEES